MNEFPFKDRRSGKDRRAAPTSPLTLKSLFGARASSRRREDLKRYYFFDRYSPFFVVLLLVTLLLSIFDAYLTMGLMQANYRELNPIMEFFLNLGPSAFLFAKWMLTAFGLITLLVLKNIYLLNGKIKTEIILLVIPFFYMALITYEIVLVINR
jgi:hypothetical protein